MSDLMMFLAALIAVWALTHFLAVGVGPFQVMARLRRLSGTGSVHHLLASYPCLSLWVAAPVAGWIAGSGNQWGVVWLALAGGSCVLHHLARRVFSAPPSSRPISSD